MMEVDIFYFYIEHENGKCVVKLVRNFGWKMEVVTGVEPYEFQYEYNIKKDMDDILDILTNLYDYVLEIEKGDIKDYM